MIVQIADQYMDGAVLKTNDPPSDFAFFPAYKGIGVTYCFVTDGYGAEFIVPYTQVPVNEMQDKHRMVGVETLDYYGLPHGLP